MESASLEEQDPENKTDNFGRSSLEGAMVNWIMKCDGQGAFYHKCSKIYIFMFKNVDEFLFIFCSMPFFYLGLDSCKEIFLQFITWF